MERRTWKRFQCTLIQWRLSLVHTGEGRVADHSWLGGNPHGWGVISFTFYGIFHWEFKNENSDHVMLSVMILFNCMMKKNTLLLIEFFAINCTNSFSDFFLLYFSYLWSDFDAVWSSYPLKLRAPNISCPKTF